MASSKKHRGGWNLHDSVLNALYERPEARNNDSVLLSEVYMDYAQMKHRRLDTDSRDFDITINLFLSAYKALMKQFPDTPTIDGIKRYRRLVQSENPELRASEAVHHRRARLAGEYRKKMRHRKELLGK